jgi:dUTP pyrophosphatase
MTNLKIFKIKNVKTPERFGKNAGIDFFVPKDFNKGEPFLLKPRENILIGSGIKISMPEEYCMIAFNKSGIATKYGLQVGACVVDENYTGEIHLHVFNYSNIDTWIKPNQKLIQFIMIAPNYIKIEQVESLDKLFAGVDINERGEHGFGSTGE